MYYVGIETPDREPKANQYRSANRRTKFTEDVAARATTGDLYFCRRSSAAERFLVPVKPGEHGTDPNSEDVEEDGTLLLVVTHVHGTYAWKPYDAGTNLVIRVDDTTDLGFAAHRAVERILYETPLGRAIGPDGMRPVARKLVEAFGVGWDEEYVGSAAAFTVDTAAESAARRALMDLMAFAPERGYDPRLGQAGADCDGVGFARDGEEYARLLDGLSDGFGDDYDSDDPRHGKPLAMLSQPVYYAVAGSKDAGRSFRARLETLMEALAVTYDDLGTHDPTP